MEVRTAPFVDAARTSAPMLHELRRREKVPWDLDGKTWPLTSISPRESNSICRGSTDLFSSERIEGSGHISFEITDHRE